MLLRALAVPALALQALVGNIAQATVGSIVSIVGAAGVVAAQVFVGNADSIGGGGGRLELVPVFRTDGNGCAGAAAVDDRSRLEAEWQRVMRAIQHDKG